MTTLAMLNATDATVDMTQRLQIVAPSGAQPAALAATQSLVPFSGEVVDFVSDLSRAILTSVRFRSFPEAVAFAYWSRAARIKRHKTAFEALDSAGLIAARGTAFHIAPANVDTIFLYSLMVSMLVGNSNIIRISRRDNPLMNALIAQMAELLERPRHSAIRERLLIVRYDHDEAVTAYLSDLCDLRIIWGGDATVNAIRAVTLAPHAIDICFADKVSLAVIDADAYISHSDKVGLARAFRNDSYWFGQMACSSPRAVVWRGSPDQTVAASTAFWNALDTELSANDPGLSSMDHLNKLLAEQSFMALANGRALTRANNLCTVVEIDDLAAVPFEEHCGGGLFLQARIATLGQLTGSLSRRNQTIVSFGVTSDEWRIYLNAERPKGIDRIVSIGQALDFDTTWDGMNLFRAFSREIGIAC
jgi:hypothetical protein